MKIVEISEIIPGVLTEMYSDYRTAHKKLKRRDRYIKNINRNALNLNDNTKDKYR